jgi:hypothetical protein
MKYSDISLKKKKKKKKKKKNLKNFESLFLFSLFFFSFYIPITLSSSFSLPNAYDSHEEYLYINVQLPIKSQVQLM